MDRVTLLFVLLIGVNSPDGGLAQAADATLDNNASAQEATGRYYGSVHDAKSGEPLVGVNVRIQSSNPITPFVGRGTATNANGQFHLDLTPGIYTLVFTMVGYEPYEDRGIVIVAGQRRFVKIHLVEQAIEMRPTEVIGERPLLGSDPQTSTHYIDRRELNRVSGNLEDITRTFQTLPGVSAQADFTGRMYVRGGRADENIVLLDRIYVYEPYHLGGLVSIFNPELIDRVEFYAGGFPAKYAGALSSIIEVHNKKTNREEAEGEASISVISANANYGGPLWRQRGSWLLSYRRSYHDLVMRALGEFEDYVFPHFGDAQIILFYPVSDNDLLSFTGLHSTDKVNLEFRSDAPEESPADSGSFDWRNQLDIASVDWRHILSAKAFNHFTVSYQYQPFNYYVFELLPQTIRFRAHNWDAREDATFLFWRNHKIETGFYVRSMDVAQELEVKRAFWYYALGREDKDSPVRVADDSSRIIIDTRRGYTYAGGYVQDEWQILPPLVSINYGVNASYFDVTGQSLLSPRLSLAWKVRAQTVLKAAWGHYYQYPNDVVQLDDNYGNRQLGAQKAIHYILGFEQQLGENWLLRAEGYYKDLRRLIVIVPAENFNNNGRGRSYGFDVFLQKRGGGKLDGWLSYSFGISKRRDSLGAKEYYPIHDQRHNLSLVCNWKFSRRWELSIKWMYRSGRPYTPLAGRFYDPQTETPLPIPGELNSRRYPAYHRLDVRAARPFRLWSLDMTGYAEFINLYNRRNVYEYHWNDHYSERRTSYQFPLLPSVGVAVRL